MLKTNVLSIFTLVIFLSLPAYAQQDEASVVVQPGAPGQATKVLPSTTTATLAPVTKMDVEFMQGMIHHHAQAVEMVALMKARTENKDLLRLGARITQSQADEIAFMKRWLISRGKKTSMEMPNMKGMDTPGHKGHKMPLMPGMLTPKQMKELAAARGPKFDRLFLTGMIQHHKGALVMVDELFASPGSGQEAQLFNFATDVDSTQRAEIRLMEGMLVIRDL